MDYQAALDVFFAAPPPGAAVPDPVVNASPARRLRDALEPVAMHAVWSPGTNAALAEHGYNFLTGYVTGRAAALGEVPSSVVAATFAVFEPGLVDALWTEGRGLLPLAELIAVRDRATIASLRGGRRNDPNFFTRMRGSGPWADLLRTRFQIACRKHGLNGERRVLRTDLFRAPKGRQGELF